MLFITILFLIFIYLHAYTYFLVFMSVCMCFSKFQRFFPLCCSCHFCIFFIFTFNCFNFILIFIFVFIFIFMFLYIIYLFLLHINFYIHSLLVLLFKPWLYTIGHRAYVMFVPCLSSLGLLFLVLAILYSCSVFGWVRFGMLCLLRSSFWVVFFFRHNNG